MLANTVSNSAVYDLLESCRLYGWLDRLPLQALQIDRARLADPTGRCAEASLIELWHYIARLHPDQEVGLLLGTTLNSSAKGLLASWVSQAETIAEALDIFMHNIALMNPSECWQLSQHGALATLKFKLAPTKNYPSIVIERSMSALVTWGRTLSGISFPMHSASFSFAAPSYHEKFKFVFGSRLQFAAASNSLVFERDFLQQKILSSNTYLKSLLQSRAQDMLQDLRKEIGLADKVKVLIDTLLQQELAPSVTRISTALNMSRQTLHRKLKSESTDFSSLLDQARADLAKKRLLSSQISIEAISLDLGFKDSSSFYKACKRWFGVSPLVIRQAHRMAREAGNSEHSH